ncbi:MAG: hypothetical protein DI538_31025 [Azospira oryzae]|nr:MAG: hypothetical protein DI538_31025 [Azospira oryzae]
MDSTEKQKAQLIVKFIEEGKNYAKFKTRVRRDARNGRAAVPSSYLINQWLNSFLANGTIQARTGKNQPR